MSRVGTCRCEKDVCEGYAKMDGVRNAGRRYEL